MEPITILNTVPFDPEQLARLHDLSSRLRVIQHAIEDAGELPSDVWSEVEVLSTFMVLPTPVQAPRLRWVQLLSAGADHAIDHLLWSDEVIFTTTSGIHAIVIGEYVLALMLAWAQRLPALIDHQRRAEWPEDRFQLFAPQELRGATVGIVGYGSIGREVGRLASAFGMRVLALQRSSDPSDRGYTVPGIGDASGTIPERFYRPQELREMLPECDYVVLAVPLTDATQNLIGLDEFRMMRASAFLVNIARGGVVDEPALIQALQEGWIAGAGLDVFVQEPLPADSPLWGMDNVILSPHIAGSTPHYFDRAVEVFVENLRRYVAGEALINRVDRATGY
jgi:phosphoglycerate dehydrogenase-like enzyme